MKPQTILTAALVVALGLFGVSQFRACKLDKKYLDLKAAYETDRRIAEADHSLSLAHIAELNNAIGQADKTIGQKEAEIVVKNAEIVVLSNQLDELIANEPVQPELESQPLVISLRKQVKTLTDLYSISTSIVTLQSEEIDVLKGKCNTLESIVTEWKQSYDKEHALRVNCEVLLKGCEARVPGPWKTVKKVALGVAAGFVAGSLLK